MKSLMKIFFAAVLCLTLASPALPFQFDYTKQIPLKSKIVSGLDVVSFNGIVYTIYTEGSYSLVFEEYDEEWVKLDVIPCYESGEGFDPITIQWGDFSPVILDLQSLDGETFLLGTETG